jgi:thioredoxin-like negative regulator of GroEL
MLLAGPAMIGLPGAAMAEAIDWAPTFELAMERARAEDKYVMVDFYTTWCHWCRVLDQKTYTDPKVQALSARMISVKVNADERKDLAKAYKVSGFPTILFLNPEETVRKSVRGFQPPDKFIPMLEQVLDTRSQRLFLAQRAESDPGGRLEYAEVLALGGDHRAAAEQLDLFLRSYEGDDRAGVELDRWIYLMHAAEDLPAVRAGIERWTQANPGHDRTAEATYYLARTTDATGDAERARKLYEIVSAGKAGSWFAADAASRLEHRSS